MKTVGQTRLIMNVDFSDKLQILAKSSKIENLIDSLFAVDKAIKDLRRMRNSTLVMEHVLLTLQRLAGYYS